MIGRWIFINFVYGLIMTDSPTREMTKWQCHKKVHAEKITGIAPTREDGTFDLLFEEGSVTVDDGYRSKHHPQIGGYYVLYEDGYKSFSPAEAFESGYTRI